MKKKLLFVMNNLNVGGAEKALVSLLQVIDYDRFEVDLFLMKHEGVFLKHLPQQVNLLPEPVAYRFFDMSFPKALAKSFSMLRFDILLGRIAQAYLVKTEKSASVREQKTWKYLSRCLPKNPKRYDLAVGYLQRTPNYYVIDKTIAGKKVGFVHNDYNKLNMDADLDRPYLEKFDRIFTISEQCETILKENFPALSGRFDIMYNIVSPAALRQLANEKVDFVKKGITLVTVGRLHTQKGFDIAVDALKLLVDKGHDAYWYILGEGEERGRLTEKIKNLGLEGRFILSGIRENPYPYVNLADIYVQPSRFEGKSIAIDEAKILGKPIVVTNFPSVVDQIVHRQNGYIVNIDAESVASGIAALIEDPALAENLRENLSREKLGTQAEIEKLYAVIGSQA